MYPFLARACSGDLVDLSTIPDAARRVAVDFPVIFYYAATHAPHTRMLDLGLDGATLVALDPLPLGSKTSFVFVLNQREVIECAGRVVSVQPLERARYRVEVDFVELSDATRMLVAKAVEAALSAKPGEFQL